jgi:hypothetical protein
MNDSEPERRGQNYESAPTEVLDGGGSTTSGGFRGRGPRGYERSSERSYR